MTSSIELLYRAYHGKCGCNLLGNVVKLTKGYPTIKPFRNLLIFDFITEKNGRKSVSFSYIVDKNRWVGEVS